MEHTTVGAKRQIAPRLANAIQARSPNANNPTFRIPLYQSVGRLSKLLTLFLLAIQLLACENGGWCEPAGSRTSFSFLLYALMPCDLVV